MPINPDAVGAQSDPTKHHWSSKDAILYALGVGAGAVDPLDELAFTTENTQNVDQQVLPTMAVVLGVGGGGAFAKIGSFNPAMLVHGEQSIRLHGPIPVAGEVETVGEVTGVFDKGKGAVVEIVHLDRHHVRGRARSSPRCRRPSSAARAGSGATKGTVPGPRNVAPERDPRPGE